MRDRIDIAGERFKADPFPTFALMRNAGPLPLIRVPFLGEVRTTTTYAATETVVKRTDLFVIEGRHAGRGGGAAGLRWWMPPIVRRLADNMLGRDDPEHRRLRRIVDGAFRRRAVEDMAPAITACAERLLDRCDSETDLVEAYARRLPLDVICDLLGLPETDRAFFAHEAERGLGMRSTWGLPRAIVAMKRLSGLLEHRIAEARSHGGSGLLAELVQQDGEEALTADEILSMCFLLLLAGFETTTHLIANAVVALERDGDMRREWCAAPSMRAIEELLRFTSPVQVTKPRFVAADTEVEGVALRRGEVVMPCLAVANADPAVFDQPERLDLDRFPNPHLAFSSGPHFCLGMQLARMEARIALERLYERFPNLTLGDEPRWAARIGIRAIERLPVRLA